MSVQYNKNFQGFMKSLVSGKIADVIAPVAASLRDDIKADTPVLTGELRDSIISERHSNFGYTIKTPLEKAVYAEYGTEDTPTFAMFRKQFDRHAVSIAGKLEKDIQAVIDKI